jgi:anti-sigma B factor antagonist
VSVGNVRAGDEADQRLHEYVCVRTLVVGPGVTRTYDRVIPALLIDLASFSIESVRRDCSLILIVEGEVDLATAPLLDNELARARATDAETIVIDLLHVTFLDSSGLHVLIKHACCGERPKRVQLTKGSPQVQRLFEIAGVLDYLPFASEG